MCKVNTKKLKYSKIQLKTSNGSLCTKTQVIYKNHSKPNYDLNYHATVILLYKIFLQKLARIGFVKFVNSFKL